MLEPKTLTRQARDRLIEFPDRPLIMGVVNVTPDSFFDGGRYLDAEAAVAHAVRLVEEGADLLDVGAESTRPGADVVNEAEERRRAIPVVTAVARAVTVPISIDTSKAAVARAALDAGAVLVNDVTALRGDPAMVDVVARTGAGIVLMHMYGTPRTMQQAPATTMWSVRSPIFSRNESVSRWHMALYEDKSFLIQVSDLVSCWYITLRC